MRTSHYPNDPLFYTLCDVYSLYVLDKANVETHAIISLSQKLLLRGNIIESDSEINPGEQIKCLIDMELDFIKNREE